MQQKIHHFCLTPYRQGMSHLFILGGRCAPPTPATSYCEATPGHPVGEGEEGGEGGGRGQWGGEGRWAAEELYQANKKARIKQHLFLDKIKNYRRKK